MRDGQGNFGVREYFDTEVAALGPSPDSTGMVRVHLVYGDTLTQRWLALDHPRIVQVWSG